MNWCYDDIDFEILKGKTLIEINAHEGAPEAAFRTTEDKIYKMYHIQSCCESVILAEIIGDITDLIGVPIVEAEKVTSERGEPAPEYPDSWTWTFYKLRTIKGGVTFRWLGESNGYYCEEVDFREVKSYELLKEMD